MSSVEVRIWGGLSTTLYELILSPPRPLTSSFELLKQQVQNSAGKKTTTFLVNLLTDGKAVH